VQGVRQIQDAVTLSHFIRHFTAPAVRHGVAYDDTAAAKTPAEFETPG
jgi:hypothetical protein